MTIPALIVIDMQNDFVAAGAPIECPAARKIVEPIRRLADLAHVSGVPVIFTKEQHRARMVDFGLELAYEEPVHCLEGSSGVEFYRPLVPAASDFIVAKRRYSAFFATDLDILLRGLRVDTLILTGVATDVCVRATAQDAMQNDYRVFVAPDCVAGTTEARHKAALDNIAYVFGKVVDLVALQTLIRDADPNPALHQLEFSQPAPGVSAAREGPRSYHGV